LIRANAFGGPHFVSQQGCAPDDVFTFGLENPTGPCKTKDDCQILCSDVPEELPNLCDSFPGNGVEWWDYTIDNPFNETLFSVGTFPKGVPEDFEIIVNNCARLWWETIPLIGWIFALIFGLKDFIFGFITGLFG